MVQGLQQLGVDLDKMSKGYYAFVDRVCKHYKVFMESSKLHDALHSHRDTMLCSCIEDVFSQIRPETALPHGGDCTEALLGVLPIAEYVFKMPESDAKIGSEEWVACKVKDPQSISFSEAARFQPVRIAFVKHMIAEGLAKNGFPKLKKGIPYVIIANNSKLVIATNATFSFLPMPLCNC